MNGDAADWTPTASLRVLRQRAAMLSTARAFFADRDVLEVETPILSQRGLTDPNIASIACRMQAEPQREVYLHTSPEFAMKRLLAAGGPDIYQICKVFRDQEFGQRHQPEFTMIEWYRRGFDLTAMIDETCALVVALTASARPAKESAQIERPLYREAFASATGMDPFAADVGALAQCARETCAGVSEGLARRLGNDRNAWLDLLMSHVVAPSLPRDKLVAVHHYPADQAALARLDPNDPSSAERFEIFYQGLEIANGYRELVDAAEQRCRFDTDRRRRADSGLRDMAPDERLLAALEAGLPDCCGVAVGFDRIVMIAANTPTLAGTISFGYPRG